MAGSLQLFTSYISLTAHFINKERKLKTECLNCGEDHTADNIVELLLHLLKDWGPCGEDHKQFESFSGSLFLICPKYRSKQSYTTE